MNNCQEVNWHMNISILSNRYRKYSEMVQWFCNNCPLLVLKCHCVTAVCQFGSQWDRSFQNRITYRDHGYFSLSPSVAGGSNKGSMK